MHAMVYGVHTNKLMIVNFESSREGLPVRHTSINTLHRTKKIIVCNQKMIHWGEREVEQK